MRPNLSPKHAPPETHRRRSVISFAAIALLAVAATAQVATIDDSGNYRRELQACMTGQTAQDRDTCLREARNAQAERQRGTLAAASQQFQANALARCEAFKSTEDITACRARVMGEGQSTGSVAGGGILREYVMTLPPEPAPSALNAGPPGVAPGATTTLGAPPVSSPLATDVVPAPAAGSTVTPLPPLPPAGVTAPGAPTLPPGPASGMAPAPAPTR